MTSDLDIYRTANVLIREHGEDAALEAAQRADAMLEGEANQFVRGWRAAIRVAKAILLVAPQCPLRVNLRHPAPCQFTSAFGGKAGVGGRGR